MVVPSEMGAAGGLYQVMTSLAPAFGNVSYLVAIGLSMIVSAATDAEIQL